MIIDMRIYTIKPALVGEFLELYREHAWPLHQKYLGRCLGWYTGLEGELNQVVHMWAYDSQADRERRRAEMNKDPAWQDYLKKLGQSQLVLHTQNRFLAPTAFSPLP